MKLKINKIDIKKRQIYPVEMEVENGVIKEINILSDHEDENLKYVLPGFVDSHVHIESSMLTPTEFARLAVLHGTVGTISDPHEIANVLGMDGIRFMIENSKKTELKIYFGAPSCVPATVFETAGAVITSTDIEELFKNYNLAYLSEVMNFPGVINEDIDLISKIDVAKRYGKRIDGHAPGLSGEGLEKYVKHGIETDHECFTLEEAEEKLKLGMKILIREGSAAKNFEALWPIIEENYENVMFCSDDKHPDSLEEGHINMLVKRAIFEKNLDLYKVLQVACINPVEHYRMEIGLLEIGHPADFIIIDNPSKFHVEETYINGKLVAKNGVSFLQSIYSENPNNFNINAISPSDLAIESENTTETVRVIEALDGQLITNSIEEILEVSDGKLLSSPEKDILKIVVINRYKKTKPAVGFIKNFGIKNGAIASSIAHDSHNVVAVGTSDEYLTMAINKIIEMKGGISLVDDGEVHSLELEVAGILTNKDAYTVSKEYTNMDILSKKIGSKLKSPFMTLSFMALLVIPELKMSDLGLFDGKTFSFTSVIK